MRRARKIRESAERAVKAEEMLEKETEPRMRNGLIHLLRKESSILLRRTIGFWIALRIARIRRKMGRQNTKR